VLDLLRSERVRGASWYLREALRILAEAESPERAAEEMRRVRPGMAPLDLIALVVEEAARRGGRGRPGAASSWGRPSRGSSPTWIRPRRTYGVLSQASTLGVPRISPP